MLQRRHLGAMQVAAWTPSAAAAAPVRQWNQIMEADRDRAPGDYMAEWLQRQAVGTATAVQREASVGFDVLQRGLSVSYETTAEYAPIAKEWLQQQTSRAYDATKDCATATGVRLYDTTAHYGPVVRDWTHRQAAAAYDTTLNTATKAAEMVQRQAAISYETTINTAAMAATAVHRGASVGYDSTVQYTPIAREWLQQRAIAGYEATRGYSLVPIDLGRTYEQTQLQLASASDATSTLVPIREPGPQLTAVIPLPPEAVPCVSNTLPEPPVIEDIEGKSPSVASVCSMIVPLPSPETMTSHPPVAAEPPIETIYLASPQAASTSPDSSEATTASSHSGEIKHVRKSDKIRKPLLPRRLICCRS